MYKFQSHRSSLRKIKNKTKHAILCSCCYIITYTTSLNVFNFKWTHILLKSKKTSYICILYSMCGRRQCIHNNNNNSSLSTTLFYYKYIKNKSAHRDCYSHTRKIWSLSILIVMGLFFWQVKFSHYF